MQTAEIINSQNTDEGWFQNFEQNYSN